LNCIGTFGGAVRLNPTSNFTAINCKFSGNSTPTGSGGAIDHENANGSYINCEFSGNQANFGGAVRSVLSSPIFINCTFSGNSANDDGGAVYNIDMANPSFTNCVIWNNRESASTKTTSASVFSVVSSNPTYSHSIIANSGGSADWDGGLGTDLGNNLDVDPLFIDAFNPGVAPSTGGDLRVTTGSPILDAGDYGSYIGNDGPETDLLGNLRLFDDPTVTDSGIGAFLYLDLGCYEGAADFTTPEIESWAVPTDVPVTTNFFEFHLSFSEIVQNLSSGDFHFSIDGNLNFSSLTIESEENGKSYSVTLSGITGAGMVRVSLEEAHDVSDPSGNKVVELTSSDLFYVDPIYTIHYVNALSTKPEVPYNTWKKAATHVQDVIPFSADGDQIWIAAGSYTPGTQREDSFRIKNEISLFGGFIGNEGSLEERIGSGVESILSGDLSSNDESAEDNSENAYQVVSIDDNNPATKKSVLLNSLVIEGGNADSEQVERQTGGGIYNAENLSVENCILRNNFGKMGGAIYSIFANLEMNSTTILGNSANFGAG
ncbi:MAG: hypothetical protein KJT03_21025, partial [Verrucomicrobiae bacterium]|nr:hypothetical protein [Verrucomicrobiae bacterium]